MSISDTFLQLLAETRLYINQEYESKELYEVCTDNLPYFKSLASSPAQIHKHVSAPLRNPSAVFSPKATSAFLQPQQHTQASIVKQAIIETPAKKVAVQEKVIVTKNVKKFELVPFQAPHTELSSWMALFEKVCPNHPILKQVPSEFKVQLNSILLLYDNEDSLHKHFLKNIYEAILLITKDVQLLSIRNFYKNPPSDSPRLILIFASNKTKHQEIFDKRFASSTVIETLPLAEYQKDPLSKKNLWESIKQQLKNLS